MSGTPRRDRTSGALEPLRASWANVEPLHVHASRILEAVAGEVAPMTVVGELRADASGLEMSARSGTKRIASHIRRAESLDRLEEGVLSDLRQEWDAYATGYAKLQMRVNAERQGSERGALDSGVADEARRAIARASGEVSKASTAFERAMDEDSMAEAAERLRDARTRHSLLTEREAAREADAVHRADLARAEYAKALRNGSAALRAPSIATGARWAQEWRAWLRADAEKAGQEDGVGDAGDAVEPLPGAVAATAAMRRRRLAEVVKESFSRA